MSACGVCDVCVMCVCVVWMGSQVHGLIVQLPLPEHIHERTILDAVSYEKDIDGFHPMNIGKCAVVWLRFVVVAVVPLLVWCE